MSPESGARSDPFQDIIREVVAASHDPGASAWSLGYEGMLEEPPEPSEQVRKLLNIAGGNRERGDGSLVRRSLDAALAVADRQFEGLDPTEQEDEYGPWPGLDAQVSSYASIAKAARRLDQEPDYVRGILDKGVSAATAEEEPPETRSELQAVQLGILAEAAHVTGQGPDYIKPLVDRIYWMEQRVGRYRPAAKNVDRRIKSLEHRIELARGYGLGSDYIRTAIDEARDRWWVTALVPTEELNAKVGETVRIASIARKAGQDRDYVHGIIEEGRKDANLGAGAEAFASLARAVHINEKPGTGFYAAQLLQEGFRRVVSQEDQDPRSVVGSINQLLHAIYRPPTALKGSLHNLFVMHGVRLIKEVDDAEIDGNPARVKHELLNTLLWEVNPSEDTMETIGIERKALSYVFKPGSSGGPGVLPRRGILPR